MGLKEDIQNLEEDLSDIDEILRGYCNLGKDDYKEIAALQKKKECIEFRLNTLKDSAGLKDNNIPCLTILVLSICVPLFTIYGLYPKEVHHIGKVVVQKISALFW